MFFTFDIQKGRLVSEEYSLLDYQWASWDAAIELAGYGESAMYGIEDGVHVAVFSPRGNQDALPTHWRFAYICRFSLDYDSFNCIYLRDLPELLEFLRYLAPVLQMAWKSDDIREELERAEEEKKRNDPNAWSIERERRKKAAAEQKLARKAEFETTREAWIEHLREGSVQIGITLPCL